MNNIELHNPKSGRALKENNAVVNEAESYFKQNNNEEATIQVVDTKLLNASKSEEFTTDTDQTTWIAAPPLGKQLLIKGIMIDCMKP